MGIVATMYARYPNTIDFSCGFQSYLSAGACSKARLDRSISRLISANKNSFNRIPTPHRNDLSVHDMPLALHHENAGQIPTKGAPEFAAAGLTPSLFIVGADLRLLQVVHSEFGRRTDDDTGLRTRHSTHA